MKTKSKAILRLATGITLSVIVASGCSTRTKLGSLIPAHYLSNRRSGEEVWLHVAPTNSQPKNLAPLILPIATAAAGAAIDYIKGQLQQEAQQYDAQFSQKVWLDTTQLAGNGPSEILITRWVDTPNSMLVSHPTNYDEVVSRVKGIVTNAVSGSTVVSSADFEERTKGKTLAFAYCIQIMPDENAPKTNRPFLVKPEWKWQFISKAKVVSFKSGNPLAWPMGLLLKTGSSVNYDVYLTVDSLINTADGYPKMVTVGISDPIAGPEDFNLSGKDQWKDFSKGAPQYGWIAIPGYPTSASLGFLDIRMTVNESDPSNVKKTLQKGAEYLDSNKTNIVNKIIGGI